MKRSGGPQSETSEYAQFKVARLFSKASNVAYVFNESEEILIDGCESARRLVIRERKLGAFALEVCNKELDGPTDCVFTGLCAHLVFQFVEEGCLFCVELEVLPRTSTRDSWTDSSSAITSKNSKALRMLF